MRDRLDRWLAAIAGHSWCAALGVSAGLALLASLAGIMLALMPLDLDQAASPATTYCSFVSCDAVTTSPTPGPQPHARPQPISGRIPVARANKISLAPAPPHSVPTTAPPTASPSSPPPPCSPDSRYAGAHPPSG